MKMKCNLWNIHQWLKDAAVPHFYSIEENTGSFYGIRFPEEHTDIRHYAVIRDETNSRQYKSVLSFETSCIYFRTLHSHEAMNILNRLLSRFTRWYQEMNRINLNHGTPDELLRKASTLFPFSLIVLCNARIIAQTSGCENEYAKMQDSFIGQKFSQNSLFQFETEKPAVAKYPQIIMMPSGKYVMADYIPFQHHSIWILGVSQNRDVSPGDLLLLHIICGIISQNILLCMAQSAHPFQNQTDTYFLSCIRDKEPSVPETNTLLSRLHWKQDGLFTVYQIELTDSMNPFFLDLIYAGLRKSLPDAYLILYDRAIFLFLYTRKNDRILSEEDFSQMLPADHLYIGQSNTQSGFPMIRHLIRQAQFASTIARKLHSHFISAQYISTQYIYKEFYGNQELQALVHPAVRLLEKLDHENPQSFGYLKTLETYLFNGTNISASARKLNLHRNSFINRIQRICDLTGLSLTDPSEREALLLSLIVYRDYRLSSDL